MVCEHLHGLETELQAAGIEETFRGKAWTKNSREWVYFDIVLDLNSLKNRIQFEDCVSEHIFEDIKSGSEAGFVCQSCFDAIIGVHPNHSKGQSKFA